MKDLRDLEDLTMNEQWPMLVAISLPFHPQTMMTTALAYHSAVANCTAGGGSGLLIRKHDHFTRARKMRRDVRALTARHYPEGRFYPMRRHALKGQLPNSEGTERWPMLVAISLQFHPDECFTRVR